MSLYEKYLRIYRDSSQWDYYKHNHLSNPFEEVTSSNKFIFEYFERGAKTRIFDKEILQSNNNRNVHSISSFFLGILIKKQLNVRLKNDNFLYLWFLTCLYHDYAYYIENDKAKYPPIKFPLERIISELNIQECLLAKSRIKTSFTKRIITQYYKYCQKELGFLNHGIIGGLLLYDRLIDNYKKIKKEYNSLNRDNSDKFMFKGLYWSSDFSNYERAAIAIINHNIWYAPYDNSSTEKLYINYKLNKLIFSDKNDRFNCRNNLLFLLLLCDTIEPVKEFSCLKPKAVLEKIDIEVTPDKKKIEIRILDTDLEYRSWFNKILNLNTWLYNVCVKETTDSSLELTINPISKICKIVK